jgi:hypothetical protein
MLTLDDIRVGASIVFFDGDQIHSARDPSLYHPLQRMTLLFKSSLTSDCSQLLYVETFPHRFL